MRIGQIVVLATLVVSGISRVGSLNAQGLSRTVKGTVVDSVSKKPIPGAAIYTDRTRGDVPSAGDGAFKVDAGEGQQVLILRRAGYVPARITVPEGASGGETDIGNVGLRQVKNDADRAVVRSVDLQIHPRLASFYDRKDKFRGGSFLTPDELERNAGSLSQIVRQKNGFRNMCVAGRRGELDCGKMSERGTTTLMGSGHPGNEEQQMCFVRVWTDDVGPERALDDIRPDEVLALEAYPTPTSTPREFPGSSCATVRLWMKRADAK